MFIASLWHWVNYSKIAESNRAVRTFSYLSPLGSWSKWRILSVGKVVSMWTRGGFIPKNRGYYAVFPLFQCLVQLSRKSELLQ